MTTGNSGSLALAWFSAVRAQVSHLSRFGFSFALLLVISLTGCASLPQTIRQSLTVIVPHQVDFAELEYFAKRSAAAYKSADEIRRQFPQTNRVAVVKSVNVLYFLETDRTAKTQTLTVRGTTNRLNVWQDVDIELVQDPLLEVPLHKGFRMDARAIYADVKPYVKKGYTVRTTGHSLGGASAGILAFYLVKDGHNVSRLVTFGSPKLTNEKGKAAAESSVKITRVVNDQDVVPMIPPSRVVSGLFGGYQHFGPEVILRNDRQYVYLPKHDANRLSVGEFWRSITDFSIDEHHMSGYLKNIEEKVRTGVRQVPYFSLPTAAASSKKAYAGSIDVSSAPVTATN